MNSSPDLQPTPKVRAWSPVELDLPAPRLEAPVSFFEFEPAPIRDHGLQAPVPAHPACADLRPGEAGPAVNAWTPGELNASLLVPFNARGAELDRLGGKTFSDIQEWALQKARLEAEAILSAAQNRADETIRQGQENAERIAEQAREEGIASGRAEISGLLSLAHGIVTEVQSWQEAVLRQSEGLILSLVQEIAGKLFGDGFALDSPTLEKVFERGLVEAKSLGDLRIRAHPQDVAALDELWPVRQTAIRGQKIDMVPDQDIRRGGYYIDGQFGSVDGRVETQLALVNGALASILEGCQVSLPLAADSSLKELGADRA